MDTKIETPANETPAPVTPAPEKIAVGDIVIFHVNKGTHAGQDRPAIVLRDFPKSGEAPTLPEGIEEREWLRSDDGQDWLKSPGGKSYQKGHSGVHLWVLGVEPQFMDAHLAIEGTKPGQYTRK